jgi:hypothetical protein
LLLIWTANCRRTRDNRHNCRKCMK